MYSSALIHKLRVLWLVILAGAALAQDNAAPGPAEQEHILKLMQQYAAAYRMPDVAYDQVITSLGGPPGTDGSWEVGYFAHDGRLFVQFFVHPKMGRRGKRKWVETRPPTPLFPWDGRVPSTIAWERWDTLRGQRLAVFSYAVSRQDSHRMFVEAPNFAHVVVTHPLATETEQLQYMKSPVWEYVPYSGSVWVDPTTGSIWRISYITDELPRRFRARHESDTYDYDQITIGTSRYMLLVLRTEETQWLDDRGRITFGRLDWAPRNYHKFDAESAVTFFGVESSIIYRH